MSISKEVNIDVLNEVYTLSAFHGLRAAHPDDQWNDQMTEETEGYLANTDLNTHADGTTHENSNDHVKSNPVLEAMQRVAGTGEHSSETDKAHKPAKANGAQHDHHSLNASDYTTTPLNKSIDDLTKVDEYVFIGSDGYSIRYLHCQ